MNARSFVLPVIVVLFATAGMAQAYDWQNRDAGSKIRGDYRNGPMSTQPNTVRRMPVQQNVQAAPAPQVVRNNAPAPAAAPRPDTTAQANAGPSRSTRTFSVEPQGSMPAAAPVRNYYNAPARTRGYNFRADRKILGYHGYGL